MIRTAFCLLTLLLAGLLIQCSPADDTMQDETQNQGTTMANRPIDSVLADHTPELMAVSGVVGTAIGQCDGQPCIKVYVSDHTAEQDTRIPKSLEGYTVDIEKSGEFNAHDSI